MNAVSEPRRTLELRGIEMTYPARRGLAPVPVLHGIAVEVGEAQLVAVAGRSGSGKTTLIRIAAGLLAPSAGMVRWDGQGLSNLDPGRVAALRGRHLGIVFQGAALIETLTAEENVALAAIPTGRDGRGRASALLEGVGLAARARHFPAQLSGGEQQRVALARALFGDPALLLVDEPTANLDRVTADALIALLTTLRTDGKAILVATHDPHLLAAADRVVRLED